MSQNDDLQRFLNGLTQEDLSRQLEQMIDEGLVEITVDGPRLTPAGIEHSTLTQGSAKREVDRTMRGEARTRGFDVMPFDVRAVSVPEARQEMREMASRLALADNATLALNPDYSPDSMFWMWDYLEDADLYWVSPEMCDLLQHAFPEMPDTTCTKDLLPSESGVVVFARAMRGMDSRDEGHVVHVQAYMWGPAMFDVTEGELVRKDPIRTGDLHGRRPLPYTGNGLSICAWRKWENWVPLGRSDWPFGYDTQAPFAPPGYTDIQLASIVEDRRIMAAFAVLSQQENVVEITDLPPHRSVSKRLARKKITAAKVRLIDIHKRHTRPPGGDHRVVEWTHRWIVKGHWRQQAWGPGRQYRRPTWISPHIKGPDDKPLADQEVVKVWRH